MELIQVIIFIVLGIFSGVITGLIPGIHINLVSMLILIHINFLVSFFDINLFIIYIISMGVTHSFIDFIPSILFGIPNPDTTLTLLPSQRMVLDGKSYEAIFLSSFGSLFGMIFSIFIIPFFYLFIKYLYENIHKYIWIVLILIIVILINLEETKNKKFLAIFISLLAGGLGILVLNSKLISNPLLILFSGIFGISSLINSLLDEMGILPKQEFKFKFKINKDVFKSIIVGGISSSFCSITPGIGNSQAAILSTLFFKDISTKLFIITTSTINTINFILSFITLYIISKSRNGAVYVISQIKKSISFNDILIYFIIIIIVSIIGFFLTLILGKKIIKIVSKINMKKINISIIVFVTILIYIMTNIFGLLALISSISLGLLTISFGIKRVHLMNILLIPIILNLL